MQPPGWYAALPTQQQVLSRSIEIAHTTAARLMEVQAALTTTVVTVPSAINEGVVQAHRTMRDHNPALQQRINSIVGYERALLKPHTLGDLNYWIVECNLNVCHDDGLGYNALCCVANDSPGSPDQKADQKERIKLLLQCGVDPNSSAQMHNNRTPLHLLIANNNEEVALFLISHAREKDYQLAFDWQDKAKNTPLLLAMRMMQVNIVLAILNEMKKFKANIGLDLYNVYWESALDGAFSLGVETIIIELLVLGVKIHKPLNLEMAAQYQGDLLKPHDLNTLRRLVLKDKVDVYDNQSGYNALCCVANDSPGSPDQKADQKERIKFLLQCGVDPNSPAQMYDNRTPLHLLIANNNEEVALFLIGYAREKGYQLAFDWQDEGKNTPLLLSVKMMQLKVVFAILEQMKNFNANIGLHSWDACKRTPLDCAVILGLISIVRALIAAGAKPHAVANRFSNIAKFDAQVIRSMLESVNIDPDQVCKEKNGHEILLYEKCLKNKSNVPVIFWPCLYQGMVFSALPDWPSIYLPPLFPTQVPEQVQTQNKKQKPTF